MKYLTGIRRPRRADVYRHAAVVVALAVATGVIVDATLCAGAAPASDAGPSSATVSDWAALPQAERRVLLPLKGLWASLSETRQQKWRLIAQRDSTRSLAARERLQARMQAWARLTPTQRAMARLRYLLVARHGDQHRMEAWRAYQAQAQHQAGAGQAQAPKVVGPVVVQVGEGASTMLMTRYADALSAR